MSSNNQNSEDADEPLFRQEVFDAKNKQQIASIVLAPSIPFSVIALVAILSGLTILAFLYYGSYTRRITIQGELLPAAGLIRVVSPQNGLVQKKQVDEGQHVNKGDVLYVLTSDRVGLSSKGLQLEISAQITARKASLQEEVARNNSAKVSELAALSQRIMFLKDAAQTIQSQIDQQRQRVALARTSYDRFRKLADQDFVTSERVMQKEIELTEQNSRLQGMQRDLLNNQTEQSSAQRERNEIKTRYANLNAQLQRSISSTQQESKEVEARREAVITAPQSGTATLVKAEVGQTVDAATHLVSLVPDNAVFEARLYAPSNAIGFIKKGSQVLLRYQAYPYQKFGLYDGEVMSVSSATSTNAEFATNSNEPVYTVTVSPKYQYVNVYDEQRPLHAGLKVEADVLQEKRKLYEWMLEPLFSISGKLAN